MANEGGSPESSTGVASIGRIDYKLQKEKDRGTNEQSIADFSQSAHFKRAPEDHETDKRRISKRAAHEASLRAQ
jgi:predicted DNA binding CopG/RHH family protein